MTVSWLTNNVSTHVLHLVPSVQSNNSVTSVPDHIQLQGKHPDFAFLEDSSRDTSNMSSYMIHISYTTYIIRIYTPRLSALERVRVECVR